MIKHIIIDNDTSSTVVVEHNNTEVLVEKGYNIAVADGFGIHDQNHANTHIVVNGHIDIVSEHPYAGISTYGTHDLIQIGADGSVKGPTAIDLHGKGESLVNRGIVNGADYGVSGDDGGYYLANLGKIASIQGYAVALGAGDDTVVNRGVINGTLDTGDGADHIDLRHGSVNGGVFGGDGNDVYFMGKDSAASLFDSAGYDIIRTSVSYVADDSEGIEAFVATGHKNIDLKGDGNNNSLGGNAGNNHLSGLAGEDAIAGGAGHDVLKGGADADTFYFRKGDGADRITDFDVFGADHDVVDFSKFGNLSFDDLMSVASTHKGDTVFDFGHGDRLAIQGVTLDEIGKQHIDVNGSSLLM